MTRLALRRPARAAEEMDEEVRFHIEARVERLMSQGWSASAAFDEAYRRFGPFDETMRGLRSAARHREERMLMLEQIRTVWQDMRFGMRMLARHPGFTLGAVLTLAIGIGATSSMFAVVKHSLFSPLPYVGQDRLVFMGEQFKPDQPMLVSYPNLVDWRQQSRSFEALEAFTYANAAAVLGGDEPVSAKVQTVSRGLFQMLGMRPLIGRWIRPEENGPNAQPTIMVSEDFWRNHLAATTRLDTVKLSVWGAVRPLVGVMPSDFRLLGTADIWFPLEISPVPIRAAGNYWVLGRLRRGITLEAARTEMNGVAARLKAVYGDASLSSAVVAVPWRERVIGSARHPLEILMAASAFVLLATCINVAMTLLGRSSARTTEFAIRASLGSSSSRLMRQVIVETMMLVSLGGALGLFVAWAGISMTRTFGVGLIPRLNEVRFDVGVTLFALLTVAAVTIAFSLIPTFAALRTRVGSPALVSMRASRPSRSWTILIGVQSAATVMLLLGAILIVRSVANILDIDAGYDPRGVSVVSMPLTAAAQTDAERERAGELIERTASAAAGESVVGLASALPTDHGSGNGPLLLPPINDPTSQKEWAAIASTRSVTAGYFQALHIPMLAGRMFDSRDRDGAPDVALVNKSLADKLWPRQDPLGKRVRALVDKRGALFTVVGVVGDARDWRVSPGAQLELYVPFAQRPAGWVDVVVRSQLSVDALTPVLRKALRGIDSSVPLRFSTLLANLNDTMSDRRFIRGMLGAFAAIVLTLTVVGVFGASSYAVARRQREFGIRLAVGATPGRVWWALESRMLAVVFAGSLAGAIAAWTSNSVLSSLLYGVSAHAAGAYAIASIVVCLAAAAATAWPALRAARTDPSSALRAE